MRIQRFLAGEFALLFIVLPGLVCWHPTRSNVHLCMWAVALYAILILRSSNDFSWHKLWHGVGWPLALRKKAVLRYCVAAPLIVLLTLLLEPGRLFSFPFERPWFWLLVMVLYPILSVIPQELVFRSFFYRRYETLFQSGRVTGWVSVLIFALVHIVFHNAISPTLCLIGGALFVHSYKQHQALKWVVLEHAIYGCTVFTAGIGHYFLVNGWKT